MATPLNSHDDSARGAGLHTVLEIVRRRRLLALLPFAFILVAGTSLAFFLPACGRPGRPCWSTARRSRRRS